ncbi:MAG TPA: sugar phosphate isomerase/epimerase family protein [bacterium]|nr:sugar phosphate isomerase/epimerase family protein [bacterium]
MRFGCCGSMVAVESDKTGVEIVEKLKEIGYDYIELSLAHLSLLPEDAFLKIKERVKASGLRCEACNNFFPPDLRLTGDHVDMEKIKRYLETALSRAWELGVEVIVFGSGPAKSFPEGFSKEKAWKQIVDLSKLIGEMAEDYNITIAIEPLRREECNIINRTLEGLELAKEVDRDNVRLLVDFYHIRSEGEDPNVIKNCRGYIKHVHFARFEGRTFPKRIDEDENYLPFINSLKEINYQDRVSVEAYSKDFYEDATATLQFFRSYFSPFS